MMHEPIAYTYDADYHCEACAFKRFGADDDGFIGVTAAGDPCEDSEGNPVGVVAPWDEWHEPGESLPQSLVCGDCLEVIETLEDEESTR